MNLKINKKKIEEIPAPIVSPIPISATDSPLVIDLPDGQKLVVGQMPTGTVIEVATWRGTGRPDSRTSRLMLGMSSPEEAAKTSNSEEINSERPQINSKRIKVPTGFSGILNKLAALTGFSSKDYSYKDHQISITETLTMQEIELGESGFINAVIRGLSEELGLLVSSDKIVKVIMDYKDESPNLSRFKNWAEIYYNMN